MTANVATWQRVSTELQDIENQTAAIDRHVAEHGYSVVKSFSLPDLSASKKRKRHEAALSEVIADMEAGTYTRLIVFSSSRLDRRDEDDQIDFLLRVHQAGGSVESVTEPSFGKTDFAGRMITLVSQYGNAEYSRKLSEAAKAANARIDRADGFRGGRPPLGYRVAGEKYARQMEPDPALVPVVRELFERTAAGQPVPVISAWLEETHGIRKNNGSITATVRRAVYWNGRWEVAAHDGTVAVHKTEAIVSHQLWLAANQALDARSSTNAHPRLPRQPDYSGRLRCGQCSGPAYRTFSGTEKSRGGRVRYYRCRGCRISWIADIADEKTEALMLADHSPELGMVIVPGTDHSAELERVKDELANLGRRNLPDDEEDRLKAELRARRDRLREACENDTPPTRRPGFTGRTCAQAWAAMSHPEKCSYLSGEDFLVVLLGRGKDVQVERVYPGSEDD